MSESEPAVPCVSATEPGDLATETHHDETKTHHDEVKKDESVKTEEVPSKEKVQKKASESLEEKVKTSVGSASGGEARGYRVTQISSCSNGGENGYDEYGDPFDLEEPFSDDDFEGDDGATVNRKRLPSRPKLNLPLPRARVRTLSGTVPPVGYAPVWGGPTMCLSCLEFFDLPKHTEKYTTHLLDEHKVVISDIELIVDLKRYVEHWRHRFSKEKIPVDSIFPKVEPKEGDPLHGRVDFYYLMSEKIKEDQKLRHTLAMRRLEEVLSCQQREREDMFFSMQCLFCRYTARGNRSKLIHHLYMIHHLNLGSPDNLVFVAEYIDLLHDKLRKNQCIYCEKLFSDRTVLMEHMRKRQHREVNPKNNYYDKFYIINYLELGKKWLDVLAEDFEDQTPTFLDSDEEEEDESWHEWQQDTKDEAETMVVCLFCDEAVHTIDELQDHLKESHKYDLLGAFDRLNLTFYERVKFINYLRKMSYNCICFVCGKNDLHSWPALRKHLTDQDHITHKDPPKDRWDLDDYLVSIFDNDHLIWLLESSLIEKEDQTMQDVAAKSYASPQSPVGTENGPQKVFAEELPELHDSQLDKDPELLQSLK